MKREGTAEDFQIQQVAMARAIAHVAHRGKTDKGGEPYITHPERVARTVHASSSSDWRAVAAAWLHDVLEDSDITGEELVGFGVDRQVVDVVEKLTRRADVSAEDYYATIRYDVDARLVKRADIGDNLDSRRLAKLDDATVARLVKKYAKALDALDGE